MRPMKSIKSSNLVENLKMSQATELVIFDATYRNKALNETGVTCASTASTSVETSTFFSSLTAFAAFLRAKKPALGLVSSDMVAFSSAVLGRDMAETITKSGRSLWRRTRK